MYPNTNTHLDSFKQRHLARACSARPQSNTYAWTISNLRNPLESEIRLPIGVLNKRNVPHLSVRELLLERDAELLEACTCCLDVVARDGDVPEALARLFVPARVSLEAVVVLRAVVVR